MKTNKKIPYGISDFEKLIHQNCYFIDNTHYIEVLENMGESYLFFFRPRRFGKSLFLSILAYYYDLRHKDKFEALFAAQYIGKHPTPMANQYAILHLNFSGIDTSTFEKTYQDFLHQIRTSVESFIEVYGLISEDDKNKIIQQKAPNALMREFFKAYKNKDIKIYLLVDEYDHFTNEILAFDFPQFQGIVTGEGYVRKFYEVIKNATWEGIIDRIFMTGVTPVTLDSLTSGFNIGRNISDTLLMHEMMGFSHSQVEELVEAFLEPDQAHKTFIMQELKNWYNGYKFSKKAKQLIYNPDMVLYFLSEYLLQQNFPDKMLDTNIASDYGKMKNLFRVKNPDQNYEVLKDIVEGNDLYAMITQQFSFEREFESADFISLLYYMGYLTLRESSLLGTTRLEIPNYVTQKLYLDFLVNLLKQKENLQIPSKAVGEAIEAMALQGNVQAFFQIIEGVLVHLSSRDYQDFDEKYIKAIIMGIALTYPLYFIVSERETHQGYMDLLFLEQVPYTPQYQFVFELKYLKKAEEKKLQSTQEEAKKQLLKYLEGKEQLKHQPNLRAYTLVVVKSKIHIENVSLLDSST